MSLMEELGLRETIDPLYIDSRKQIFAKDLNIKGVAAFCTDELKYKVRSFIVQCVNNNEHKYKNVTAQLSQRKAVFLFLLNFFSYISLVRDGSGNKTPASSMQDFAFWGHTKVLENNTEEIAGMEFFIGDRKTGEGALCILFSGQQGVVSYLHRTDRPSVTRTIGDLVFPESKEEAKKFAEAGEKDIVMYYEQLINSLEEN
jgi:hypothetical protein